MRIAVCSDEKNRHFTPVCHNAKAGECLPVFFVLLGSSFGIQVVFWMALDGVKETFGMVPRRSMTDCCCGSSGTSHHSIFFSSPISNRVLHQTPKNTIEKEGKKHTHIIHHCDCERFLPFRIAPYSLLTVTNSKIFISQTSVGPCMSGKTTTTS